MLRGSHITIIIFITVDSDLKTISVGFFKGTSKSYIQGNFDDRRVTRFMTIAIVAYELVLILNYVEQEKLLYSFNKYRVYFADDNSLPCCRHTFEAIHDNIQPQNVLFKQKCFQINFTTSI